MVLYVEIVLFWFDRLSVQHVKHRVMEDVAWRCPRSSEWSPRVAASSSSPADPALASKYKVNFKLMEANDRDAVRSVEADDGERRVFAKSDEDDEKDFEESTVSFVSSKSSDPNYSCLVVFQKPEGKVYCISAYMMETYLGRYAFRANFYFRSSSRRAARKCFSRVVRAVKELKQDVMDDEIMQVRVPYMLKKRLSGIEGEIEPKINAMANYLAPENVQPMSDPSKNFSTYLPTKRSIVEDLDI